MNSSPKNRCSFYFFILFFFFAFNLSAQKDEIDSLLKAVAVQKADSVKVSTLCELSWAYKARGEYDKGMKMAEEARDLALKINDRPGLSTAYNYIGVIYYRQSKLPKALENLRRSLDIADSLDSKSLMVDSYNNIGLIYNDLGDYGEALKNYMQALTLSEEIKDNNGTASALGNIGIAYHFLGNDTASLRYFMNSLAVHTSMGDKKGMAFSYNNIGIIQTAQGQYDEALVNFKKSLAIKTELGQKRGLGAVHINMGDLYKAVGDNENALEEYTTALAIFQKSNDELGVSECLMDLGIIYTRLKKFPEAEKNLNEALQIVLKSNSRESIKNCYEALAILGIARGDYKSAYENYKLYADEKDSIQNDETTKKIVRAEMNYGFDKKQAIAKAEEEKREAVHVEEAKKQKLIIYFGTGILLLVLGFALFAYRSYLQKQKANLELDEKNHKIENAYRIIEHKNTEITDSINYAKKIQQSILPDQADFIAAFPGSFVFYRPKDIVGGDFYFLNRVGGKNYLAVADCTGHGVPGAFMSLVGSRELQLANEKSDVVSEILAHLNRGMKETLKQNQLDKTKDGMDVALLRFEGNKLFFSSANRPLWILRNGKNEMEEIKSTKAAIGGFTPDDQVFEKNEIDLQRGDIVYIFSDGFSDQFGGEKGKKMTTKRFREFLLENHSFDMKEQGIRLEKYFDEWKGVIEQIDDVLVIGIKI